MRVFFDEINMEVRRLRKADGPPPEWVSLMQSAAGLNRTKKADPPLSKREFFNGL